MNNWDIGGRETLVFGELIRAEWDWGRNEWTSSTMKEETLDVVRPRINKKIEDRFFLREIGVSIPGQWKMMFHSRLESIMDDLGPLYDRMMMGVDISGVTDSKSYTVESEYPQEDIVNDDSRNYADRSTMTESTSLDSEASIRLMQKYHEVFKTPDNIVLEELEPLFSTRPVWLKD